MAAVIVAGLCFTSVPCSYTIEVPYALLKVTASGCKSAFFDTLELVFLGLRELDRDLNCGALLSAAWPTAALELLTTRFVLTEPSFALNGFCLKTSATEIDFVTFTGGICLAGGRVPCRRPEVMRSTSILLH
jgi:hypothetical protein